MDEIFAAMFGFCGGLVGGLLGVGGGILFVPGLAIFLDQTQVQAEATSLLAIVPVAILGSWRQYRYGNVHVKEGLAIGALSLLGVGLGVVISNAVSQRTLELAFACLVILIAFQLLWRTFRRKPDPLPDG